MNEQLRVWQTLASTPRLGPKSLAQLAIRLNAEKRSVTDLLTADLGDLVEFGMRQSVAEAAITKLRADMEQLPSVPDEVQILSPGDDRYPIERLNLDLPLPTLLYAWGNVGLLRTSGVAIAGSRSASKHALSYADRLAQLLAGSGLNVVSGHAAGIDMTAHAAALHAEGTTTAVLAEGIGRYRPKDGLDLCGDSALIVSQFHPQARWRPHQAMDRNTTIAALSESVVVVAAGLTGGSWAQGQLCLTAGKPLFVVDFRRDEASGNAELIRMGGQRLDRDDIVAAFQAIRNAANGHPQQGDLFQSD